MFAIATNDHQIDTETEIEIDDFLIGKVNRI